MKLHFSLNVASESALSFDIFSFSGLVGPFTRLVYPHGLWWTIRGFKTNLGRSHSYSHPQSSWEMQLNPLNYVCSKWKWNKICSHINLYKFHIGSAYQTAFHEPLLVEAWRVLLYPGFTEHLRPKHPIWDLGRLDYVNKTIGVPH